MNTILVVDDEADLEILIKQKFRKQIRQKEYSFLFAGNGVEALSLIEETSATIDMVLSDINMPEMDGLTLLNHLHESSPLLKTVIVSAYGDMDNIRSAMNSGAYDFITKPIDFADLEITMKKTLSQVEQINKSLEAIRENNILKMYVDESVISFMNSDAYESQIMANENIDGAVLFIDICGFTTISENAAPDVVVKLINTYFEVMVQEIVTQNGHIDKFIGDAVMAVFRGEYHLDRAIDAALAVRSKIAALPSVSEELAFSPQVSIGIKSGEMISGNIGSASLKRLDYTVIGDTVNTAARLQDAAEENQIVIALDDFEKIKESFECEALGSVKVKNKVEPQEIYNVVG